MDEQFNEMEESLGFEKNDIVEAFNNTLSKLLARMTAEQREKAIENKSDNVLNNIFKSAYHMEHYEVCLAIKQILDKRNMGLAK